MATSVRTRIRTGLAVFWLSVLAFVVANLQARGVAPSVWVGGATVEVEVSPEALVFAPVPDTAAAALVFYPGGLVDPAAYAPLARGVAEAGYRATILTLPFRQAPLERHRTRLFERTRAALEADGRAVVVGGHSRGGALAAQFARRHPEALAGLLLVGTSHPREHDLSALDLDVTKVFGSEDGLASEAEVRQFAPNLPASTDWVRVEGGDHAQFGWYGWQLGSGRARISREQQQAETVRAVLGQLARVAEAEGASSGPPVAPGRGRPD